MPNTTPPQANTPTTPKPELCAEATVYVNSVAGEPHAAAIDIIEKLSADVKSLNARLGHGQSKAAKHRTQLLEQPEVPTRLTMQSIKQIVAEAMSTITNEEARHFRIFDRCVLVHEILIDETGRGNWEPIAQLDWVLLEDRCKSVLERHPEYLAAYLNNQISHARENRTFQQRGGARQG